MQIAGANVFKRFIIISHLLFSETDLKRQLLVTGKIKILFL